MKKTILSVIVILTLAALITSCTPGQTTINEQTSRTVSVTGTGTIDLEPDIARVNIGVRTQSPNVADALEENTDNAEAIIQSLQDLGVEASDIQTRNFNIYPQQDTRPGPEEEPTRTFVVENTVAVVVRDLDSLGEILATVVSEGANTINGVTFDVEDRETAIEEARSLAIEDAQAQAEAIAEAAGVDLGPIQTINLSRNGGPAPRVEFAEDVARGGSVPISGGTLTIQVTANLEYRID